MVKNCEPNSPRGTRIDKRNVKGVSHLLIRVIYTLHCCIQSSHPNSDNGASSSGGFLNQCCPTHSTSVATFYVLRSHICWWLPCGAVQRENLSTNTEGSTGQSCLTVTSLPSFLTTVTGLKSVFTVASGGVITHKQRNDV